MTRDYIRNTTKVEKFTRERLRSDCDFLIRCFKTGFSEKFWFKIKMKTDHKVAVCCLLDGVGVFAVLRTGFGKSFIFQAFVMAIKMTSNYHATPMVYTPLNYKWKMGSEF